MMMRRVLERIYEAHGPSVFALFCQFTRNEADARDLLQDWLVKIGRGFDRLPEVENERAYLLNGWNDDARCGQGRDPDDPSRGHGRPSQDRKANEDVTIPSGERFDPIISDWVWSYPGPSAN